jgi:hypothetical protein
MQRVKLAQQQRKTHQETRSTEQMTAHEKISVEMVNKLKGTSNNPKTMMFCGQMTKFPRTVDSHGIEYYDVKATYRYGRGMKFGRLYAYPSLQIANPPLPPPQCSGILPGRTCASLLKSS